MEVHGFLFVVVIVFLLLLLLLLLPFFFSFFFSFLFPLLHERYQGSVRLCVLVELHLNFWGPTFWVIITTNFCLFIICLVFFVCVCVFCCCCFLFLLLFFAIACTRCLFLLERNQSFPSVSETER